MSPAISADMARVYEVLLLILPRLNDPKIELETTLNLAEKDNDVDEFSLKTIKDIVSKIILQGIVPFFNKDSTKKFIWKLIILDPKYSSEKREEIANNISKCFFDNNIRNRLKPEIEVEQITYNYETSYFPPQEESSEEDSDDSNSTVLKPSNQNQKSRKKDEEKRP